MPMRPAFLLLALLLAAAPAGAPAQLHEVLHPKAALPAFRCFLPAAWTQSVDPAGNLQLANRDRTANFSLAIVPSSAPRDALDPLARTLLAGALVAPWDSREPAEISGHRGHKYTARIKHPNGALVRAEVILVAIGDAHIGSCSMLLGERVSKDEESTARLVQAAVKLIPTP